MRQDTGESNRKNPSVPIPAYGEKIHMQANSAPAVQCVQWGRRSAMVASRGMVVTRHHPIGFRVMGVSPGKTHSQLPPSQNGSRIFSGRRSTTRIAITIVAKNFFVAFLISFLPFLLCFKLQKLPYLTIRNKKCQDIIDLVIIRVPNGLILLYKAKLSLPLKIELLPTGTSFCGEYIFPVREKR